MSSSTKRPPEVVSAASLASARVSKRVDPPASPATEKEQKVPNPPKLPKLHCRTSLVDWAPRPIAEWRGYTLALAAEQAALEGVAFNRAAAEAAVQQEWDLYHLEQTSAQPSPNPPAPPDPFPAASTTPSAPSDPLLSQTADTPAPASPEGAHDSSKMTKKKRKREKKKTREKTGKRKNGDLPASRDTARPQTFSERIEHRHAAHKEAEGLAQALNQDGTPRWTAAADQLLLQDCNWVDATLDDDRVVALQNGPNTRGIYTERRAYLRRKHWHIEPTRLFNTEHQRGDLIGPLPSPDTAPWNDEEDATLLRLARENKGAWATLNCVVGSGRSNLCLFERIRSLLARGLNDTSSRCKAFPQPTSHRISGAAAATRHLAAEAPPISFLIRSDLHAFFSSNPYPNAFHLAANSTTTPGSLISALEALIALAETRAETTSGDVSAQQVLHGLQGLNAMDVDD